MFCPQCGHQQVSTETRFCSRCGIPLGLVTDLISNTSTQLQREKRELTGVGLMMGTILMLFNFLLVLGLVMLPHMANPVFFWIWLAFMVSSLVLGGFGLSNLIRGDFFKRLKEREARLVLMKAEEKRQKLSSAKSDSGEKPLLSEPASVTEMTTRELHAIPRADRHD